MKLKFLDSYSEGIDAYKANSEYDFIDARKANYFINHGLAVPIEAIADKVKGSKQNGKQLQLDTKQLS